MKKKAYKSTAKGYRLREDSPPLRKPRLLDLFCCAGGAGFGYSRAGFEVVGVDKKLQPNYPFTLVPA
jgi:tRNA/tmRNA/rRNA uracil-C5-methylase (TrmA/RlmC/RlmD family)